MVLFHLVASLFCKVEQQASGKKLASRLLKDKLIRFHGLNSIACGAALTLETVKRFTPKSHFQKAAAKCPLRTAQIKHLVIGVRALQNVRFWNDPGILVL